METQLDKSQTDRIQKKAVLRAPRSRVWRAISDPKEFGAWFGLEVLEGSFSPGSVVKAKIVPTKADAEVAKTQKPYEGMSFEMSVDRVEPERLFSFRWHPFATEQDVDYSKELTTLIVFELADAFEGDGVLLTITESGFDKIPLARRAKAFAANEDGWEKQLELIGKYLGQAS